MIQQGGQHQEAFLRQRVVHVLKELSLQLSASLLKAIFWTCRERAVYWLVLT
jgi:hypothetical protein